MSDGWQVYRSYNRLRCWAHLIRKDQGLNDRRDYGSLVWRTDALATEHAAQAVYAARERPPDQALPITYQGALSDYRCACKAMSTQATHAKARALAKEMHGDWDATIRFWHNRNYR